MAARLYAFDSAGWYAGLVPEPTGDAKPDPLRCTPVAPPIDSTTTTAGEKRAQWWKSAWTVQPYLPRPVPAEVPMWAAREVLILRGLFDAVVAAIDGIKDPTEQRLARNRFDTAGNARRADPWLQYLAQQLGLTDPQLDELFLAAQAVANG